MEKSRSAEDLKLGDADRLVAELFAIQRSHNPDRDPGDLTIGLQDDMAVVEIYQDGRPVQFGRSITEALESAIEAAKTDRNPAP